MYTYVIWALFFFPSMKKYLFLERYIPETSSISINAKSYQSSHPYPRDNERGPFPLLLLFRSPTRRGGRFPFPERTASAQRLGVFFIYLFMYFFRIINCQKLSSFESIDRGNIYSIQLTLIIAEMANNLGDITLQGEVTKQRGKRPSQYNGLPNRVRAPNY